MTTSFLTRKTLDEIEDVLLELDSENDIIKGTKEQKKALLMLLNILSNNLPNTIKSY